MRKLPPHSIQSEWSIHEDCGLKYKVSNAPKLPLNVTSMPTNYLEGMPEKSLSCHFTTHVSAWSSLNATGTFGVKISAYTKNNLIPMVEGVRTTRRNQTQTRDIQSCSRLFRRVVSKAREIRYTQPNSRQRIVVRKWVVNNQSITVQTKVRLSRNRPKGVSIISQFIWLT